MNQELLSPRSHSFRKYGFFFRLTQRWVEWEGEILNLNFKLIKKCRETIEPAYEIEYKITLASSSSWYAPKHSQTHFSHCHLQSENIHKCDTSIHTAWGSCHPPVFQPIANQHLAWSHLLHRHVITQGPVNIAVRLLSKKTAFLTFTDFGLLFGELSHLKATTEECGLVIRHSSNLGIGTSHWGSYPGITHS